MTEFNCAVQEPAIKECLHTDVARKCDPLRHLAFFMEPLLSQQTHYFYIVLLFISSGWMTVSSLDVGYSLDALNRKHCSKRK